MRTMHAGPSRRRSASDWRSRLEVAAERGLTPFVGRERELGLLLDAFDRARSDLGQVTFVVGDAGIGKSRLLLELRRRVGDEAAWQEGHCLSFGRAMAFHPLVDLLRRRFGVEEGDADAAIATKIERGVAEVGEDPRSEEHTSELQSRSDLVCRLLLEKKN